MSVPIATSRAAVHELAYREGVRALEDQGALMEAIRTRAGLLLSAAAIATSFLGGISLDRGFSGWSWLAIGTFCALGAAAASILWPRGPHRQFVRPDVLLSEYAGIESVELPEVHRDLALHLGRSFDVNRGEVLRLVTTVRGCSLLLPMGIALWVVDLAVKG